MPHMKKHRDLPTTTWEARGTIYRNQRGSPFHPRPRMDSRPNHRLPNPPSHLHDQILSASYTPPFYTTLKQIPCQLQNLRFCNNLQYQPSLRRFRFATQTSPKTAKGVASKRVKTSDQNATLSFISETIVLSLPRVVNDDPRWIS